MTEGADLRTWSDSRRQEALELADELASVWGSWGPSLSPDGSAVAFVSDRNGRPELFVDTGDAQPVRIQVSDDPVVTVHWSADGNWLGVAVATNGGVRQQVWVVEPGGTGLRHVAGCAGEHAVLGPWTRTGHQLVVGLPPTNNEDPSRFLLIEPSTGQSSPLAVGDLLTVMDLSADERFVLVRDGTRGAQFCVFVDRLADRHFPLLVDAGRGSIDGALLRPSPPHEPLPYIAFLMTDAGLPRRALLAQPIGTDGTRGEAGVLAERPDAELEFLDADDEGGLLLLGWNVNGRSEIELLDTKTGTRRAIGGLPAPVVDSCALSRDGSRVMLSLEGPDRPRELHSVSTASMTQVRVQVSTPMIRRPLVAPTLERYEAHDGLPLSGWLYRPTGQAKPGPAVLSLHGGPEAQERPTFSPQHQALVAAGFTVFAPNIRGSSGYGRAFVHADDRNGRWDGITDAWTSARFLIESGLADPARIAITGRSYGGYLTLAALVRYPGTFAAAVDICGMSDLRTFYRDTEPWIAAAAVSKYGDPETDTELLADLSPLPQADRIEVPLLVVHGERDTNVPIGESHQIVAALRALGRPVRYLEIPGEGHEYRRADSRRLVLRTMVEFLIGVLGS